MSDDADLVATAARLLGRPVRLVTRLSGGEHARTVVVGDGESEYVLRRFPPGDPAVEREVAVLGRLSVLGDRVPRLIAHEHDPVGSGILTDRMPGGPPAPTLPPATIAAAMARALERIHRLPADGLRRLVGDPVRGRSPIAERARARHAEIERLPCVLTHQDFWCGNALWAGERLTGIVDWSGAGRAPRGLDVAWCRLDLVLLGSLEAADAFLAEYCGRAGVAADRVGAWDCWAAAKADPVVGTWAPNYAGIGRHELSAAVLRRRLDDWITALLHAG